MSDVGTLRSLALGDLLDQVAAATPAPGGGSTAGVVCALAGALVQMAASLGDNGPLAGRAARLRACALDLAERDLTSYEPVLEARRRPAEDPGRDAAVAAALVGAAEVPVAIAGVAGELATLAEMALGTTRPAVAGDAAVAAVLAEAACAAATMLAQVNLGGGATGELAEAAARAAETRGRSLREMYE